MNVIDEVAIGALDDGGRLALGPIIGAEQHDDRRQGKPAADGTDGTVHLDPSLEDRARYVADRGAGAPEVLHRDVAEDATDLLGVELARPHQDVAVERIADEGHAVDVVGAQSTASHSATTIAAAVRKTMRCTRRTVASVAD
jgi:hypothetical protein